MSRVTPGQNVRQTREYVPLKRKNPSSRQGKKLSLLYKDSRCEMNSIYKRITESRIWKDAVWSKLIADSIRYILAGIFILTGIGAWVAGVTVESIQMFIINCWHWMIHVACITVIIFLWRNNRNLREKTQPKVAIGLDWLLALPKETYDVLMWFPINNTLTFCDSCERIRSNLEDKPLFRQLLDNKVLFKNQLGFGTVYNKYEIDRDVFEYYKEKSKYLPANERTEYVGHDDNFRGCFY